MRTVGLTKYYGDQRGLEGLDLTVRRGEVFGFLGPNGAGKTTTLRLLLDLIRPTSGTAEMLGLDCQRDSLAVRRRVGYLPGDLALYEGWTGRELLSFLAGLRRIATPDIDTMAERFGVDLDRSLGSLSRGNRQKVGLVQAFMHRPDVVVLDEPTSGLDPIVQHVFQELVREVTSGGATVLLSSHVLSEVQAMADRAGVIRAGRLVAVEDVDALRAKGLHHVEVVFEAPVPPLSSFSIIPGVRDAKLVGNRLRCILQGDADAFVKAASRHHVVSISSHEADLEDVFLAHYRDPDVT